MIQCSSLNQLLLLPEVVVPDIDFSSNIHVYPTSITLLFAILPHVTILMGSSTLIKKYLFGWLIDWILMSHLELLGRAIANVLSVSPMGGPKPWHYNMCTQSRGLDNGTAHVVTSSISS